MVLVPSTKKSGKPVLQDINEGKKTLLLWHAYKNATKLDKKTINTILNKKVKKHADLVKIKNLMIKYRSDEYCIKKCSTLVNKAFKTLSELKIKKEIKKVITNFINKSFNT